MLQIAVVLLAAGASSRMGRPKMLLPWADTTVLGHLFRVWNDLAASQIAVVSAQGDTAINLELERLGFPSRNRIANTNPARGMFSSIQCAASWTGWQQSLTHWAIVLGDQPHLQPATLRALIDFALSHPQSICQPSRSGRPRHPVILPEKQFRELAGTGEETLKDFLSKHQVELLEMEDVGLDLDIDRPADYEKARELF